MGKEPLMKFKISKEIIDKTIKCEHNFDCLAEHNKKLCKVVQTTGSAQEVIFVEPNDLYQNCPYVTDFADSFICTCPIRIEIYKKYGN